MSKRIHYFCMLSFMMAVSMAFAQHPQHLFYRPIYLQVHYVDPIGPGIIPNSLDHPLPCDIEAYQSESGVDIIVNDVPLVGSYHVYVFDHHQDIVYSNSFFWQDGTTSFISTATWPEDTYTLYIAIPGGWLEGEFEIE